MLLNKIQDLPDLLNVTKDSPGCDAGLTVGGCTNEALYRWYYKGAKEFGNTCKCFPYCNFCLFHHDRNMKWISEQSAFWHGYSYSNEVPPCYGWYTIDRIEPIRK